MPDTAEWIVHNEITLDGQTVKSGEPIRVNGLRGVFRFKRYVQAPKGEWVECLGLGARPKFRSFDIDKVHPAKPLKKRKI